jgi:NADH:ubiquinone oxidoreductase subunit E
LNPSPELAQILERFPRGKRENLIPILQEAQEAFGYLSQETMQGIGSWLGLASSKVYGVATFYNQFRFEKKGECHCQVCRGTACHVKGSERVLESLCKELDVEAGHTTRDGKFSVEVVACIGACGLAPVVTMDGDFHADVSPGGIRKLVKKYSREMEKSHA